MPPVSPVIPGRRQSRPDAALGYAQALFREFLESSLVLAEDWEQLDPARQAAVTACREEEAAQETNRLQITQ